MFGISRVLKKNPKVQGLVDGRLKKPIKRQDNMSRSAERDKIPGRENLEKKILPVTQTADRSGSGVILKKSQVLLAKWKTGYAVHKDVR